VIKHKVNDHAGDRHVEPDWQGNPGDAPVTREIVAKRAIESERYEGNDHDCENRVTRQDHKVERADPTGSLKMRGAVVIVINEIRSEKEQRHHERRDLARAMSDNITRPNESVTGKQ